MDRKTEGLFHDEYQKISSLGSGKYRCMGCMSVCDEKAEFCPYCGYKKNSDVEQPLHIFPGTVLNEKYQVGRVIGSGGFGITYLGWDLVLERKIAIKEYLPSEFATRSYGQTRVTVFSGNKATQFADGKKRFIEEAKKLAKFQSESGIVRVFDSFEENETAYIVMEYLDGETLAQFIEREGKIPAEKAVELIMPVIESLNTVHDARIIHRDIAPDNIFLTKNGEVKLIDFGAARYAAAAVSNSLTVIIKPGYSAEEQYRSRGDQGPHTDVYSLGAVLYKMITGETPPDALERRANFEKSGKDTLIPIKKLVKDVPKNIENAIYNAMNVRLEDRTPDMINFAGELMSEETVSRKGGKLKKIDILKWPLWLKISLPSVISIILILSILLGLNVIGPEARLERGVVIPDGMAYIPDVVTYNIKRAKKRLNKNGLNMLIADKRENDKIDENLVLLQNPDAGNITAMGTFINVTVSAGVPKEFVPDVSDYDKELAKKQLEELGFAVNEKEEYNKDHAPGAVISQGKKPGKELPKGDTITIVIGKGDKDLDTSTEVTIPNVTGMNFEEAKALLKDKHIYISIGDVVYSDEVPEGQIISQLPTAETKGHTGDTVKVTVSLGEKKVYMPDIVYRTEESATEILKESGINYEIVREENKDVAEGTVFEQSVEKGAQIKASDTVIITVSKGYTVTVPSVVGMKMKKAQKQLTKTGLVSTVTFEKSETVRKGEVISQSIEADTKVKQGTVVNLVISSGTEEISLPTSNTDNTINSSELNSENSPENSEPNESGELSEPGQTNAPNKPNEPVNPGASKPNPSANIIDRGKCGDNVSYTLDSNGLLTISGTGAMYDYSDEKEEEEGGRVSPFCGKKIKKVVILNGVTSVGDRAFAGYYEEDCAEITNVTIPNSVTKIGAAAFAGTGITSITIPGSVKSIASSSFNLCDRLTSINVAPSNKNYCSVDGVLFNKSKTELVRYPGGKKGTYTIPNSVTSIGGIAFSYCTNLKSITIPSSVTSMGNWPFDGWTSSQTIYIQGRSESPSGWQGQYGEWYEFCDANIVWNA